MIFFMQEILITGGCGFIGSSLAVHLSNQGHGVSILDNLSRRGSEHILNRVLSHGCKFFHGDVRNAEDFTKLRNDFSIMIECSAEPSVLVGTQGQDARFMVNNNLLGSVNCFEFVRERKLPVIFLSTSRVYPYNALNACEFTESDTRFELLTRQPGISQQGISTDYTLSGVRSLYGATKLASELLLQEYSTQYDIPSIINRCGVIAGPWQLGKIDQGVFTHWLASHYFGNPLNYIGFGGQGKQVRDLLHISDLAILIEQQIAQIHTFRGKVFHAGGARLSNLSLLETTLLCRQITGKTVAVGSISETRPADVKWYITNNGDTEATFKWHPTKKPADILQDTYLWLQQNETLFRGLIGG